MNALHLLFQWSVGLAVVIVGLSAMFAVASILAFLAVFLCTDTFKDARAWFLGAVIGCLLLVIFTYGVWSIGAAVAS